MTRSLRFIDSFRFMRSGLASLVDNLKKDQLDNLNERYEGRKFDLLSRKGIYPYDYVDSLEKLNDTCLPPEEAFYSKLNESKVTDKDYEHAKDFWQEINCQTLRD